MKFIATQIPEVVLIEPTIFSDNRGFFFEARHDEKFAAAGIPFRFVQENISHSKQGVLRGLHYQVQQPQGKLVRVIQGEIFDVVVDLRRNSPTFGQSVSAILTDKNYHQLWVPPGFAHGFYTISSTANVVYCCTELYAPQYERTIIWNDPEINIAWPLDQKQPPILSPKDAAGCLFKDAEYFD